MSKYIGDINEVEMDNWISDLRSGKYKQTQGYLQREGAMCCLGVLAVKDCSVPDTGLGDNAGLMADSVRFLFLPPAKSVEKLNLPEAYVKTGSSGSACVYVDSKPYEAEHLDDNNKMSVTGLNDAFGLSFDQIADRLEETFLRKE